MSTRVLVLPGYSTSDHATQVIRSSLALAGHTPHRWRLGRNEGPSPSTTAALAERLEELHDRDGRPVALVGWSLGGLYAHWLAAATPHLVHSVTSLGSPLRSADRTPRRLAVPVTSVFTRGDRVVPWTMSLVDPTHPRHENIEVRGTHLTLGIDPAVLWLISDRVAQNPATWRPFSPPFPFRLAYPTPDHVASPPAA
ncbi:MAG: alpha/beta hydrolase [Acidimicrobiales bacterium]